MSHTPGPWTAETHTAYRLAGPVGPMFQVVAYPQSSYWVAYVQDTPEGRANARLIAAAPELLDALKLAREIVGSVRYQWKHVQPRLETIDAAIAKAEGDQHD